MKLTGPQLGRAQNAIVNAFDEGSLRQCLKIRLTKNLDHISKHAKLPDRVFELLNAANDEGWVVDLLRALKSCNSKSELHKALDAVLGESAGGSPEERWQAWLEVVPPPPIAEVNPYEVLFLNKAEVGDAYDFSDKAKLPPYVPRGEDAALDKRLAPIGNRGGFVLVVGRPKSGKSRTAFEALSRHCASRRLIVPRDFDSPAEIVRNYPELAADLQIPRGCGVLWLDDLHNSLSEEYLLLERTVDRTLKRLIDEHGLLVMATIWDDEYGKFRQEAEAVKKAGLEMHRLARKLLALAELTTVTLSDRIEAFRRDDIEQRYPRQRYGAVWSAIERGEGLATALIAWKKLRETFEYGSREVKAVVRAAVDIRRAGIAVAVPRATLEGLFDSYLVDEGDIPADTNEVFEKAVKRASRPIGRYQRLLEPQSLAGGPAYVPYDALVYYIDRPASGTSPPLLAEAWEAALEFPGSHFGVGLSAYSRGNQPISERAFRTGVELREGGAAVNLGVLLAKQGKTDEAERAFRTGVELGEGRAAFSLGVLLEEQGKTDEAERAFRTGVKLGEGGAAFNLGLLLAKQGKTDEAERAFRTGVELGEGGATVNLGVLLEEQGKTDEAERAFRTGVELREGGAAFNLGLLLAKQGKTDEAERAFRTAFDLLGAGPESEPIAGMMLHALQEALQPPAYDSLMQEITQRRAMTTAPGLAAKLIPIFRVDLDRIRDIGFLSEARPIGWRYLGPVAVADVRETSSGRITFSRMTRGLLAKRLLRAAQLAADTYGNVAGDYELRILEIPALHMSALWLHRGNSQDEFFLSNGEKVQENSSFLEEVVSTANAYRDFEIRDINGLPCDGC